MSVPDGYDPGRTLGPEVAAVATLAGFPPDPEQRFLLDVSFALDKRGRFLVFETVVIAPRQNLKTGFGKQRALGKLFVCDRPLMVWSAHEFDTSRRALLDLEAMIAGSDQLRKQVRLTARGKVASHGAVPEITLNSGATLAFRTRTAGGGAGLTGDDLNVDEAWAAQSREMGVILPIMLARPNSQVDFLSSACRPESAYLWDLVRRGRAGGGPRMFYAEWCAPPSEEVCDLGERCDHRRAAVGCGCDKPEVIVLAHSAVTRGRIELEKVTDLRRTMPEGEFPREIMGWHDEPVDGPVVFKKADWAALRDLDSEMIEGVGVGVDVGENYEWAAVSVGGTRADGLLHVEVGRYARGAGWVLDFCRGVFEKHPRVVFVIDKGSPTVLLLPDFEEENLPMRVLNSMEARQACGMLVEAVAEGTVRHRGQGELDTAVAAAQARPAGDGGFTFGRRASTVDIAPLNAACWAHWFTALHGPIDINQEFGIEETVADGGSVDDAP